MIGGPILSSGRIDFSLDVIRNKKNASRVTEDGEKNVTGQGVNIRYLRIHVRSIGGSYCKGVCACFIIILLRNVYIV